MTTTTTIIIIIIISTTVVSDTIDKRGKGVDTNDKRQCDVAHVSVSESSHNHVCWLMDSLIH